MRKSKSTARVQLTPQDMWSLRNNEIDGGIDGYVLPKEVFDHKQIKWLKERENILKNPKQYRAQPKLDDEGNPIPPPKRPNFLDEVMKWAHSYYDKEKAEKTRDECEQKNHPIDEKPKPKSYKKIDYPKRQFYSDFLIRQEQKKYEQVPDREDLIADIVEKTKEWEKARVPFIEKTKEAYSTKDEAGRFVKATFGKSTRVTVVSEAEHVGEKYPFYNTYKNPDGDEDDTKGKKKLFFPSVSVIYKLLIENCSLD